MYIKSEKLKQQFALVKQNKYGFYEIANKPGAEELEKFYQQKYYQENKGPYQSSYTEKELALVQNKIEQKYLVIKELLEIDDNHNDTLRLLDIGSGEGWALKFFKEKKWEVLGLDFSDFGCKNFNSDCLDKLMLGNIYDNIDLLISENEKYDVIWLTNSLEHVLDPEALLFKLRKLISLKGILLVQIPNDFSKLQFHLLENEFIDSATWIAPPDHLSYFGKDSLTNLMNSTGWKKEKIQADYPIDFNLFNDHTNYIRDKTVGKSVHHARVEIENFLHNTDPDKTNQIYEILGEMGLGRQIVGFFSGK
jgi:2-polyprenyl-3-methyl-5-hydroxy-6-metoxy-1,4-benzoquinol methylase